MAPYRVVSWAALLLALACLSVLPPIASCAPMLRRRLEDLPTLPDAAPETVSPFPIDGAVETSPSETATATVTDTEPDTETEPPATTTSSSSAAFVWEPLETQPTEPTDASPPTVSASSSAAAAAGSQTTTDKELALSAPQPSTNALGSDDAVLAAHAPRQSSNLGPALLGAIGIACVGAAAFVAKRKTQRPSPHP